MSDSRFKQAAAAFRAQHGVFAKREAARYMDQAIIENRPDAALLWQSVVEQLIKDESDDPSVYDAWIDPGVNDASPLIGSLDFISRHTSLPSHKNWITFKLSSAQAVRYIRALETVVAQLLADQDGARFAAVKLLVAGLADDQES